MGRRVLGVMAVLIAVATVYGRYHYLADVTAGFLIAGMALLITRLGVGNVPRRTQRGNFR
jgi:membrane-associated phospholipid phosphatase